MGKKGADFSDVWPRDATGTLSLAFAQLPSSAVGIDTGVIAPVTPNNAFRLGQQIFFWLGVANPPTGGDYITRLRLKLWWARPNMEFRQGFGGDGTYGSVGTAPIDTYVIGDSAAGSYVDNRYLWVPSPKKLDITEYQTPPPAAAPARNSDSLLLDDCLVMDFPDPATISAKFGPNQTVSRWTSILYPAMGYALGMTYDVETFLSASLPVSISLSWAVGTFGGGRYEESVG